jgi:hypothetical protein
MNRLVSLAAGAVLAAAFSFGQVAGADHAAPPENQRSIVAHRLHGAPPHAFNATNGTTGNGISYNGGPLILGGTNIYYIWYGDWSADAGASTVLTNFANSLGGSPYFNINTTYFDSTSTNVTNKVTLTGSVVSTYVAANPTNLNDGDIWGIVTTAFSKGLAQDPNGVYFVLTAPGVGESTGFLSSYCGWHTAATYNGTWIKYSFVGDANGAYACTGHGGNSPNNDVGADAMASVIAHELEEATTDPLINAWYSGNYQENADKCAWTFGATFTEPNGSSANMTLGGHDYLIQQNWVNAQGGLCALSYSTEPDYNLTLTTSSSVSVSAGNTATYGLGINAVNAFSSAVSLSVSGLPSGAAASFSPNPMTTSSTLSVLTASSTPAGTYALTITGSGGTASGGGPIVKTIAASLTVTAPATPDFTLSVSPTSQTVVQGNPTPAYQVTVTPLNGFSGSVTLSVTTPLPAGAGWSATSGTPSTKGTVTLTTSASTPPGSYPFTIQGTGGGKFHTLGATLVVNSVGSFSISVSPNPLVVKRGSSGMYTVTVTPAGGFNSPVTLTIAGLPPKTSASPFTVNPVPGSGGAAQITITAARNATFTKKPATITVTGKGGNLSFFGTAGLTIQ